MKGNINSRLWTKRHVKSWWVKPCLIWVDKSELIKAICPIAISGVAHDWHHNEVIRTVKTLDQLTEALNCKGSELKRYSVYRHLLPWNHRTTEGTRHVTTAPVKLYKSQNLKHASHPSTKFACASIRSLEELAAILDPPEVTFHSQDDKAKVPIRLTPASKQASMFMHMEYQSGQVAWSWFHCGLQT